MKTDISITVKRTEDSGYRGNMYLGFAALFCGVLSVLLFISGFNAIGYTGELVYLSAFLLSFIFCYVYYNKPQLSVVLCVMIFIGIFIAVITGLDDLQLQAYSVFTAFSEGRAAVRNITKLMCVFTPLLVGVFYLFEIVFKVHFVLSFVMVSFLLASPFLKISISVFNIFIMLVYQILFYLMNNLDKKKRKTLYSSHTVNSRKNIMGKCTVMCAALFFASFVLSAVIMNTISEPVYNSVSGIEEVVYKVSSIASNRASDISMNGGISTGNNYQTGAEQINLTTQRKPEEDVYLIGYRGGEYTGNNWNKADDVQICNELDKKKGNTYARYSSIYSTSEVFGNLYYLGNYIMKSNGLAVSKDKDRRLQLDIAYTSDKNNIMLEPYCSNLYLAQKNSYDEYSVMYYEQKDMVSLWDSDNITDLTKKSRMDDYINVQSNYKTAMKSYYTQYSDDITPQLALYVKDNPLSSLEEKTTFILYTLMSNTSYTRTPGIMLGNTDVADKFLFESKKGYCVHYATAATLMYRMYGIPARYVTGFKVSADSFKENADGQWSTAVTDSAQHSWTEIFIDNYGWVPVDVTPAADGTMRASYPGYNMEIFNQIMQQNNWTADMPSINDISKEKTEYVRTWQGAVKAAIKRFLRLAWRILKILLLFIAVIGAASSPLWLRLRRNIILKRQNKKKAVSIYKRLMCMLHTTGYVTEYDGTEENFADVLAAEFAEDYKEDVTDIKRAVDVSVQSEFSLHRADTSDMQCVLNVYNKISDIIYNRLRWWEKIVFRYVYCF